MRPARADRAGGELGALFGHGVRRQGPRRSTIPTPTGRLRRGHAGPRQRPHGRPRCRSSPAPPTSSTSATTIMPGGRSCTGRAAASSPGSRPTPARRVSRARRSPRDGGVLVRPHRLACRSARPAAGRTRSAPPVREVRVRIETGKVLRILTNDLDAPAQDIADLYKRAGRSSCSSAGSSRPEDQALRRHQRERRAHPDRRRADRLPAAAMAQPPKPSPTSPLAFARLVRANLMHRGRSTCSRTPPRQPRPPTTRPRMPGN